MQHCISSARCLSCHTADKAARHTPVPAAPPSPPPTHTPSSPLQSHRAILYTSCSKPSHPCTSTPSTTYSSHFLESCPSISRSAIAFTFFLPPFPQATFPALLSPRKNYPFFVILSFSRMPCFLFTNIHLLSCFHPQLFLLPSDHWSSLCSLLPHDTPRSAKVTAPEEVTGERITTHLPVSLGLSSSMISVPQRIPVSPSIFRQPFSRPCPGSLFHPGKRGVN